MAINTPCATFNLKMKIPSEMTSIALRNKIRTKQKKESEVNGIPL